ncbi:MAG: 3-isopropylmalate dehydratase small subunit [Acidobacteriota bacterium]
MSDELRGRALKVGDNIDTDVIIPARHCVTLDTRELAAHCMEDLDPRFLEKRKPGDFVVAGTNFGSGSSREQAPLAIKGAELGGVIAASFARIFFRNAINVGLPLFESPAAAAGIEDGDEIEVLANEGLIVNHTQECEYPVAKYPPAIQEIMKAGGMVDYVKGRLDRSVPR